MKASKFMFVIITICVFTQSTAFISIQMHAEDLTIVNDFFAEMINVRRDRAMLNLQLTPQKHPILRKFIKKFANSLFQMGGIMVSLVGAGVLTHKLTSNEPAVVIKQNTTTCAHHNTINSTTSTAIKSNDTKINVLDYMMCRRNFGCMLASM